MKATLENYIEFVKTRNPNRKINHGSWYKCSVGDFIARSTKKSRKSPQFREAVINFLSKVLYDNHKLNMFLGNGLHNNIPTYGALTKWLEDNGYIETKFEMGPNQKAWVAALRSGKYKQSRQALQNPQGFCCLGVACEVSEFNGITVERSKVDKSLKGGWLSANQQPTEKWLALNTSATKTTITDKGEVSLDENGLMHLNDRFAYSFEQIADFIEEHAEDLFTESK